MGEPEPVVGLLEEVWASIVEVCTDLTPDEWARPTRCPGWTVQDQVAHLLGGERMLMGEEAPERDVEGRDHIRNAIGAANEQWVDHYRDHSGGDVLEEFRAVTAERLDVLANLSEEQWAEMGFTPEGEGPYRQFMAIRVFDAWMHEQDIREAVGRPGHLSGLVVEASVDRLVRAMGYVVGKKAGVPGGSSVVFEITGDAPRTVPVVVNGRAEVVREIPPDPTVTITLDLPTYAALCGGRDDPGEVLAAGRVTFDGDDALGENVVRKLAFMI